jgi:hypothetical protein
MIFDRATMVHKASLLESLEFRCYLGGGCIVVARVGIS